MVDEIKKKLCILPAGVPAGGHVAQRYLRVGVSVEIAAAGDQQTVSAGKTIQLHGLRSISGGMPCFHPGQPRFFQGKKEAVHGRRFQPQPVGVRQHRSRARGFQQGDAFQRCGTFAGHIAGFPCVQITVKRLRNGGNEPHPHQLPGQMSPSCAGNQQACPAFLRQVDTQRFQPFQHFLHAGQTAAANFFQRAEQDGVFRIGSIAQYMGVAIAGA